MFLPGHPFLFMNIVSELTKLHNNIGHILRHKHYTSLTQPILARHKEKIGNDAK